jgi:hypothetical protein
MQCETHGWPIRGAKSGLGGKCHILGHSSFLFLAITNISMILMVLASMYISDDDETKTKPQEALL